LAEAAAAAEAATARQQAEAATVAAVEAAVAAATQQEKEQAEERLAAENAAAEAAQAAAAETAERRAAAVAVKAAAAAATEREALQRGFGRERDYLLKQLGEARERAAELERRESRHAAPPRPHTPQTARLETPQHAAGDGAAQEATSRRRRVVSVADDAGVKYGCRGMWSRVPRDW
jgi:hypothetical protein